MITGTNPYVNASVFTSSTNLQENTNRQNVLGKQSRSERIADVGIKQYVREIQTEKLEEQARQYALRKLKLSEEKLEKIGAVAPQKLVELEANIQEYITEYLQKQVKAELMKEAQEQGKPGYRQGALVDLSI